MRPKGLSQAAMAILETYRWPGNVRELENLIEREFLMSDDDGEFAVRGREQPPAADMAPEREPTTADLRALSYREAKARALESFDRLFLCDLMRATRGNVTAAARAAGKERRDLGRLLRKYDIQPSTFRG